MPCAQPGLCTSRSGAPSVSSAQSKEAALIQAGRRVLRETGDTTSHRPLIPMLPFQKLVKGVTLDIRANWEFQSAARGVGQGPVRNAWRVYLKMATCVPSKRVTLVPKEPRLALCTPGGKESSQTSSNGVT
uniref:Histone H3.3-like n=1 Tax=Callorhinus ursinus TaxID=34884 RepID=A0A3Q7PI45_CALUR|nr:histone H3.3-like [Callorhinus ursinus]